MLDEHRGEQLVVAFAAATARPSGPVEDLGAPAADALLALLAEHAVGLERLGVEAHGVRVQIEPLRELLDADRVGRRAHRRQHPAAGAGHPGRG